MKNKGERLIVKMVGLTKYPITTMGGVSITPDKDAKAPLPVIMWIHGGGFIGASEEETQVYGMTLANPGYGDSTK